MERGLTMAAADDLLAPILARKRREVARRRAHLTLFDPRGVEAPSGDVFGGDVSGGDVSSADVSGADVSSGDVSSADVSSAGTRDDGDDRGSAALARLRRRDGPVRVIAEVKFRSPSAGVIRPWSPGEAVRIARAYVDSGAAAVSVLCDRAGFGGSPLALRRVVAAVDPVPVLFKEFVIDALQLDLARHVGASMVLLLVRALDDAALRALVIGCRRRGLEPVVEAADEAEVERALLTEARVIGVNARDLSTFRVDPAAAAAAVRKVPRSRVAVYMSGVSTPEELARLNDSRVDAVLIGSALMKDDSPGRRLTELLRAAIAG